MSLFFKLYETQIVYISLTSGSKPAVWLLNSLTTNSTVRNEYVQKKEIINYYTNDPQHRIELKLYKTTKRTWIRVLQINAK